MATREAIAIRQEKANARLEKALRRLHTETGVRANKIELTERDATARMAELSERLADMVEDLLRVTVGEENMEKEQDTQPEAEEVEEVEEAEEAQEAVEAAPQPGDIVAPEEQEDIEPITAEELAEVDTVEEEDDGDTDQGTGSGKARSQAKKLKATGSSTGRN